MLYKILEAHNGKLPEDVVVLFQNTGREMPGTLDFVRDCETHWNVKVIWLEYALDSSGKPYAKVVDYNSASRAGEPFDLLLENKPILPNPISRFCTTELKLRTAKRFLMKQLGWAYWTNVIGLRADEPKRVERVIKYNKRPNDRWIVKCPLAEAGITQEDVLDFWKKQPFDLKLAGSWEGNCDGCFLKSRKAILRMAIDHPDRLRWWAQKEQAREHYNTTGSVFRKDRENYTELLSLAAQLVAPSEREISYDDLFSADPQCGNSCEPIS